MCSLFPADVAVPPEITLVQGDGSALGCFHALQSALRKTAYDVVHVHAPGSAMLTLAAYLVARRSRRDLVFSLHTSWPNVRPRNRFFMYLVAALFPVFVACSDAAAESLPGTVRRLARRLEVVPNGVDVDRIDRVVAGSAKTPPPAGRAGLVVSVGRLIPIKDPATVLGAFARAARPQDRLVMVGDGELLATRSAGTEERLGSGRVAFTGLASRADVYRILHDADVFVSASTVEGLPVAVLEAMASRCLVVLSDIAAHREIVRLVTPGPTWSTGVHLVTPGDVAGFAAAIDRVAAMSPAERIRAGEELRVHAIEHYGVRTMNEAYGRIYARMADRRPLRRRQPRSMTGAAAPSLVRRVAYAGACGLLGAAATFAYAGFHPPTFQADVTLAVGDGSGAVTDEARTDGRGSAVDLAGLVERQPVLQPVARQLGVADWRSLRAQVRSTTSAEDPLLIVVTTSAGSSRGAERLGAAVADQLMALTASASPTFDAGFVESELARFPEEIDAARTRLEALSAREPAPMALGGASQRAVADLRAALAELQAGYQSMLAWRSGAGDARGLTVVGRTDGRAGPPLPDPGVLAAAGGVAGACLWVAGWLLLRRDQGSAT